MICTVKNIENSHADNEIPEFIPHTYIARVQLGLASNHGLLNLEDGTLIWRRMNSYTWALEGPNVCDVAIECDHFPPWDGLVNGRKSALTKKEVTLDLWNLDTTYSDLYSTPLCNLFSKRPRYRRYTGEQIFHKKISVETAFASPQKCVFMFCPCSRFFLLEMF